MGVSLTRDGETPPKDCSNAILLLETGHLARGPQATSQLRPAHKSESLDGKGDSLPRLQAPGDARQHLAHFSKLFCADRADSQFFGCEIQQNSRRQKSPSLRRERLANYFQTKGRMREG